MINQYNMMILGSRGMLGQMVCNYFKPRVLELIEFAGRFNPEDAGQTIRELAEKKPDIVINCVGAIKQRTSDHGHLCYANAILPLELKALLPKKTILVQPSTDCVFNGASNQAYQIQHPADAKDVYGWSKCLGEIALIDRPRTLIPRVSIIGTDIRPCGPGLLNWFLQQPEGSEITGFQNHFWNGITTLEWCIRIEELITNSTVISDKTGVLLHLGCAQVITKHDLLCKFARIFKKNVSIRPHVGPEHVNRGLSPDLICNPIEDQLNQLARLYWQTGS